MPASFRMTPLSPKIGTEIVGLDLARPLDDDTFREIETALDETTLLVVRDQDLTPSQQVAFSLRFGPLETYPMRQFTLPDQPEVLIVSTVMESGKPIGVVDAGLYWHFDSSWRPKPSLGSVFYARELSACMRSMTRCRRTCAGASDGCAASMTTSGAMSS
jgi:taurine dioxygenase